MNSFSPEHYDEDVILVEMQSLGRARGFAKIGEYSALNDEVLMGRIADRLHVLLALIEGERAGAVERENQRLDDLVEELEDEVRSLEEELRVARERIMEYEDAAEEEDDEIEALLILLNETLGGVYDEEFEDLASAVGALVEEYRRSSSEGLCPAGFPAPASRLREAAPPRGKGRCQTVERNR